jgi:hypothetical protein
MRIPTLPPLGRRTKRVAVEPIGWEPYARSFGPVALDFTFDDSEGGARVTGEADAFARADYSVDAGGSVGWGS